jgi:hypothetical protein
MADLWVIYVKIVSVSRSSLHITNSRHLEAIPNSKFHPISNSYPIAMQIAEPAAVSIASVHHQQDS